MSLWRRSSIAHQSSVAITSSTLEKSSNKKSGLCSRETLARARAGRDRNGARAEKLPAGDIVFGVADDIDAGDVEIVTVFLRRARPRESAEFIAIVMIVGKGAEFEVIPKPKMPQLNLRAALQISREQTEHAIFTPVHALENFLHPGQDASV